MLVINLQHLIQNCQEKTYNNKNMSEFNPKEFADWLNDAFRQSHYKSLSEVAKLVGVSRTTMSMYAGAKPQTTSNKPSRPKREICIKLAEIFNEDVDKVLMLGGHAPNNIPETFNPEINALLEKLRTKIASQPEDEKAKIETEFKTLLLFLDSKT